MDVLVRVGATCWRTGRNVRDPQPLDGVMQRVDPDERMQRPPVVAGGCPTSE